MSRLLDENEKLERDISDLITCQICSEQFQSAGERIPCKLKCQHIICKKCAEQWLNRVSFNLGIPVPKALAGKGPVTCTKLC